MIVVNSIKNIRIYYLSTHHTIAFAAEELLKYIKKISGAYLSVEASCTENYSPESSNVLWIGLCGDLGLAPQEKIDDPGFDDYIHIDINQMSGIIAGINPRSVLIGVYRFLTETGCRWIRPGKEGEYIPEADLTNTCVRIHERPAYRHRGICIEGAVSCENLIDMIDFIPKLGINSYFLQFRESFIFFERWYLHKNNTAKSAEPFSISDARVYMRKAVGEIKKRSLLYHAAGHGWTCEPLGIPGLGWDPQKFDLPDATSAYLAEVNGKREIWEGVPLNTNLCYSNQEVQNIMIKGVIDYLKENRDIDVLHFWLADEKNNQCECETCKILKPSDYFIQILNRLDERLSSEGIEAKIVFLIYLDLLWAPDLERIHNIKRFTMMFAPFTRTYSREFRNITADTVLPPYERNKLEFSSSVGINLMFLKKWQSIFTGDSFDFDYHLWWDLYNDPGHYIAADLLGRDIKALKQIGLNGFVSCQVQRAFFPTGLGMYVMARILWNSGLTFEEIAADYFNAAFGDDGYLCKHYLEQLSLLFDPEYLRGEKPSLSLENAEKLSRIPALIKQFRPIIKRNLHHPDMCRRKSWEYLRYHSDISYELSRIMREKAFGNNIRSLIIWENLKTVISKNEDRIQSVFDLFEFIEEMRKKLI